MKSVTGIQATLAQTERRRGEERQSALLARAPSRGRDLFVFLCRERPRQSARIRLLEITSAEIFGIEWTIMRLHLNNFRRGSLYPEPLVRLARVPSAVLPAVSAFELYAPGLRFSSFVIRCRLRYNVTFSSLGFRLCGGSTVHRTAKVLANVHFLLGSVSLRLRSSDSRGSGHPRSFSPEFYPCDDSITSLFVRLRG